jgi:hypothetical protein
VQSLIVLPTPDDIGRLLRVTVIRPPEDVETLSVYDGTLVSVDEHSLTLRLKTATITFIPHGHIHWEYL